MSCSHTAGATPLSQVLLNILDTNLQRSAWHIKPKHSELSCPSAAFQTMPIVCITWGAILETLSRALGS